MVFVHLKHRPSATANYRKPLCRLGGGAHRSPLPTRRRISSVSALLSNGLCTEAGATGFVPAVIDRLSRKYPRVVFFVVTADPATLIGRELPQLNIELAIGATIRPTAGADIQTEILFDKRQVVMADAKSKWVGADACVGGRRVHAVRHLDLTELRFRRHTIFGKRAIFLLRIDWSFGLIGAVLRLP